MTNPAFPKHITIAADQLSEAHIAQLAATVNGWATWERVGEGSDKLRNALHRTDILVGWADGKLLAQSSVQTYLCGSAGYEAYVGHGLDRKPGFQLTNAAGVMSVPIAEHCLSMMFALARQLPAIWQQQARHHWQRRWHGSELHGSTVCIVGLGSTGGELARRCRALGMKVVGVRRQVEHAISLADVVFPPEQLAQAVAEADHVVCLLPGGEKTRHFFNETAFAAMKPGAFFYSASRGSVTDENALLHALQSGHLAGAGLDVFETEPLPAPSPLWDMENVIVSPHCAGHSNVLAGRLTELFTANLKRCRDGQPLLNLIEPEYLR